MTSPSFVFLSLTIEVDIFRCYIDPQSVSPGSIMPKFSLTDEEIYDLTSYMLSLKSET